MDISELAYPAFQANQVLTSAHLNTLFGYLDDQQRLTRANLIGIGIACGFGVTFESPGTVHLTRGVGVTSQGHLIVESDDLALAWARSYTLPDGLDYPPLEGFDLWELFGDDDEPGATPLATTVPTLTDKAVVLFLELHQQGLRTCSPSSCDDRGEQVSVTVRRLLVDVADLDSIQTELEESGTSLEQDPGERLDLPDLRLPRFDVPATGPVHTAQVLRAFQAAFSQDKVVKGTAKALSGLYQAFRPLLVDAYPDDPFAGLVKRFGFLDTVPETAAQVRALPTYWDLFDDLLAGYDEARWAGLDLWCACAPPGELFPRHLMAGALDPSAHAGYRHRFLASPAVGDCEDRTREFRTRVDRLVAMLDGFTAKPPDKGVRATPSRPDAPLAARAIPAHYEFTGTPPLYRLWDPVKTARRRAHHNLGYRSDEYVPAAPAFVTDPLRFDLEPNEFLRIEGHLGQDVRTVLAAVNQLRTTRRLPFEVVAVRTGEYDEKQDVDRERERCRFRDLDTLYEVLKASQVDFLVEKAKYFYTLPVESQLATDAVKPSLRLLSTYDPEFVAQPGTLGRLMETSLTLERGQVRTRQHPVVGAPDLPGQALALVNALSQLSTELADDLPEVDFALVADRQRSIAELADQMATFARDDGFDRPELGDRLAELASRSRQDPFETLAKEYARRLKEARQAQFLSHFLARHPGIQHKAGVPLGGTFVLVHHGPATKPAPDVVRPRDRVEELEMELDRLRKKESARVLSKTGREQAYLEAVKGLAEGTVIADFFLPYACGSDCPPILCLPPTAPVTATATVGCTNADQHAEVTLTVTGAQGKVSVRVDDGDFAESAGSLSLVAGQHTIVVRDESGTTSAPLTVVVPEQLSTGEPDVVLDEANRTYRVSFAVRGGTPPYVAEPGQVDDTTYTGPDVPVTDNLTVKLSDSAGCTLERSLTSPTLPSLTVDVTVGCTGSDEHADVTLQVVGAEGQLSVQVDDGDFTETDGSLRLPAGGHTLVVRDESGTTSAPSTVVIPEQLSTGEPDVVLDEANGTYRVSFAVRGGTPPYVAEPGQVEDTTYTGPDVPVAQPLTVKLVDSAGCTLVRTVQPPTPSCDLPCGGDAERWGYRFWLPQPAPDFPILEYQVEVQVFMVVDENGQQIDLRDRVAEILAEHGGSIDTVEFAELVKTWLQRINDLVAETVGSDQWFRLAYQPPRRAGTTGTLVVDRLRCLDFAFELQLGYLREPGEAVEGLMLSYQPGETAVTDPRAEDRVVIPAFNGSASNRCRPEERPVPLCKGFDLQLVIQQEGAVPELVLAAEVSGGDVNSVTTFVWEVQDAVPPLFSGDKIVVQQVEPPEPPEKLVRLTAFTDRGCTMTVERRINVHEPR